jgi:hypothetical protein
MVLMYFDVREEQRCMTPIHMGIPNDYVIQNNLIRPVLLTSIQLLSVWPSPVPNSSGPET